MPHQKRAVVALAALWLSACAPSAARQGLRPVRTLLMARGLDSSQIVLSDTAVAIGSVPSGPLALDAAVRLAVLHSPHIRVVLTDVGLAAADLWQASRVPNPVLDLMQGFARGGGPGVGNVGIGFSIVSALQTPLRRRIAASELRGVEARVANAVFGAMIDVQRAYFDVQHAQQTLELERAVAAGLAASTEVARALRDAGNVAALNVASEEAMSMQSVADVVEADAALGVARAELGRLLGAGVVDTGWTIEGRLPDPPPARVTLAMVDSLALAKRLDVAAARERALASASALGLSARFRFLADGTLGAFWEREPDGRFVGGSLSLPIPVFDGGGASVARARATLRQRTAEHDALVVNANAEVRAAVARMEGARRRAEQLRTAVLPARRRVVEESQLQVNAMSLPVFALLQARQAEIESGRMYIDALRDYWVARAELERAAGGPLPSGRTP